MNNIENIESLKAKIGMQNLDVTEDEAKWLLDQDEAFQKSHGDNPRTRPQAIANGAAVLVIAASLGISLKQEVDIKQDKHNKKWYACTEFTTIPLESLYNKTAIPKEAALSACLSYAGVSGEIFTGNGHPLSGLDLCGGAIQLACYIDRRDQAPSLTYWHRIANLCYEVLAYNEDKFSLLFSYLDLNNGVKECQAKEILEGIRPVNINQIFGGLQ